MNEDPELRRSSQYSQLAFGVFVLRWVGGGRPRVRGWGSPGLARGQGCPG